MKPALKKLVLPTLFFIVGLIVANFALSVHQVGIDAVLNSKFAVVLSGVGGAIIAACISVYGVRAANQSSLERLAMQHEHDVAQATAQRAHDAIQKTEDRKSAIRREVYTKGIEAVHELLGTLGRMADTPLSDDPLNPALLKFLAANSKIWLVAEPEAAHLSRELANQFMELIFVAVPQAYPQRCAMEPIRELDARLEHARAEVMRIETRVAVAKEQGESNESRHALAESLENAAEWVKTLKQTRETSMAALGPQRKEFIPRMLALQKPVQETVVRIVSALRVELALSPDYELFMAEHEDQYKRAKAAVARLFGD
ncbi:hypothetical protein [Variovorax paradoxus]|uniref:hypothetical protein n=1 Tax=Variovorax paradoxus TaxID=34073 RepID=UPI003ECC302A